ncbi:MAG: DinB family protein [Candidatus Acidiferrum sp.]
MKLGASQSEFLRAADSISAEQWTEKPSAEEWSAAEVVAHLIMVESAIVGSADRMMQKKARPVSFWKRMHLPLRLAEMRLLRLKTPIPVDPTFIKNKEEMLSELRSTRERALAFLAETQNRDLSGYSWNHPFLGRLNTYEWFGLIAAHQVRHTKQVKEIAEWLKTQKDVRNK